MNSYDLFESKLEFLPLYLESVLPPGFSRYRALSDSLAGVFKQCGRLSFGEANYCCLDGYPRAFQICHAFVSS